VKSDDFVTTYDRQLTEDTSVHLSVQDAENKKITTRNSQRDATGRDHLMVRRPALVHAAPQTEKRSPPARHIQTFQRL
jgi:hypothetical protein